ncbi:MAG TPA: DUF3467 domain-containing protein [Trueperaceae bacterium]|nr:DUF3467 domain-containing protein [Trueperaceae bacterium]
MDDFKFDMTEDVAKGRYANLALITHTRDEFIVDFALAYPQRNPVVTARVVTSPRHAKALLRSLEDNIRRYEAHHGVIPEPQRTDADGSN